MAWRASAFYTSKLGTEVPRPQRLVTPLCGERSASGARRLRRVAWKPWFGGMGTWAASPPSVKTVMSAYSITRSADRRAEARTAG